MPEKRVVAITSTLYKPNPNEQGIFDMCAVLDDGSMQLVSILEGSPVRMTASILRDFADKLEETDA